MSKLISLGVRSNFLLSISLFSLSFSTICCRKELSPLYRKIVGSALFRTFGFVANGGSGRILSDRWSNCPDHHDLPSLIIGDLKFLLTAFNQAHQLFRSTSYLYYEPKMVFKACLVIIRFCAMHLMVIRKTVTHVALNHRIHGVVVCLYVLGAPLRWFESSDSQRFCKGHHPTSMGGS